MHHRIKVDTSYFKAIVDGDKNFEIRYNDRGYQKGDTITLQEVFTSHISTRPTGRLQNAVITYVTNYNQKNEWVVFGIKLDGDMYDTYA